MNRRRFCLVILGLLVLASAADLAAAGLDFSAGADIVSRYNWRGLDFGDAPAIQPALGVSWGGMSAGIWGSYSSGYDEIDTWVSYTIGRVARGSITVIVTDYYVPSAGIRFFDFHNFDGQDGPGAHLVEAGLVLAMPEALPLSISSYVNIYNDRGYNAYFQVGYVIALENASIALVAGIAGGSPKNPSYLTEDVAMTNLGLKVTRQLNLCQGSSLPLSVAYVLNPEQEQSFLVLSVGF